MFRKLGNRLEGRKERYSHHSNMNWVEDALSKLSEEIHINFRHFNGAKWTYASNLTPSQVRDFLDREFYQDLSYAAIYQIFSGGESERHYFDFHRSPKCVFIGGISYNT